MPQTKFFSKNKKIPCNYYPLSFCKILKEFLELILRVIRIRHFWVQNDPIVLNKNFLVQTNIITFIYLLALCIVQNLQKILLPDPKLWGCAIFGTKIVHFLECYYYHFHQLLAPFILQNFRKILPADPELWRSATFGPKMAHFNKW